MGIRLALARHFAASAVMALVPVAGAFVFAPASSALAQTDNQASCAEVAVLASPMTPWKGAPLRVVFAAEEALDGELSLIAPNERIAAHSNARRGGPPYFWSVEVPSPAVGTWKAMLVREGAPEACRTVTREIVVAGGQPKAPRATSGSVWPLRDSWNRETENLYSAWIETLFEAPLDQELSWKALHEGLRDRSRNLLFDHLGLHEDGKKLVIQPDCADLPYFLRAYFAFKMGLPFGYSKCTRGGGGKGPKCVQWWNVQKEEPPPAPPRQRTASGGLFEPAATAPVRRQTRPQGLVPGFGYYVRTVVADGVHSGNGRPEANDDDTDFYPVALTEEALRPGTIYADPYGHILVLARRVPQTDGGAGVFLAVDAQPDGTVARKRFWRGNFLFAQDPALGGPGFKRFRPIVREKNGTLRRLTNAEIAKDPDYGDFSPEQTDLSIEAFYDRMDDVMSPAPLEPLRAMQEVVTSLEEQVQARVTSVENGRKFQASGKGEASMPDGWAIFETSGPWEDFATPSRDLRLLIAMDVVAGFPDRVARRPERYKMHAGKSVAEVKAKLESVLASELASRKFTYPRSDGSEWTLTLKDVLDRAVDLEMAYNPNDCVELRWGAPATSEEAATCKRKAPSGQRAKMSEYRAWFQERRRPPRDA
jgi:hypothetical protein